MLLSVPAQIIIRGRIIPSPELWNSAKMGQLEAVQYPVMIRLVDAELADLQLAGHDQVQDSLPVKH